MTATQRAGSVAWDERRTAVYVAITARRERVLARWKRRFEGIPPHVVEDAFDAIAVAAVASDGAFRKDPADDRAVDAFIAKSMHNTLVNYVAGPASRRTSYDDRRLAGACSAEDVAELVVQRDEAKAALELAAAADPRTIEYMLAEADGFKRAELRGAGLSDRQIRNRRSEADRLRLRLRRKLGALWPIPAVQRLMSALTGSDATATAGQLAAGGGGRGAGSVLAAQAIACLIGAGTIGGACVATGVIELPTARDDRPAARARATAEPDQTPVPRTARMRTAPEPTPTPKPTRKRASSKASASRASETQGGTSPSSHEQTTAASAPAGSLPAGQSEFGASSATSSPSTPVPAAPGANEFGP